MGYLQYLNYQISELDKKSSQFQDIFAKTTKYKEKVLQEKKNLNDLEANLQVQIDDKIERLKRLKFKKQNIEYMTSYVVDILKRLASNKIIVKEFELEKNKMIISVQSKEHFNIGNFSDSILKEKLYNLKIEKITFDEETKLYSTKLILKKVK